MRIINQQGTKSYNFDNIEISVIDNMIECVGNSGKEELLGVYKNPERAKELFVDIHNAYSPVLSVSDNMTTEKIEAFIGSENVKLLRFIEGSNFNISTNDFVYEMPNK